MKKPTHEELIARSLAIFPWATREYIEREADYIESLDGDLEALVVAAEARSGNNKDFHLFGNDQTPDEIADALNAARARSLKNQNES